MDRHGVVLGSGSAELRRSEGTWFHDPACGWCVSFRQEAPGDWSAVAPFHAVAADGVQAAGNWDVMLQKLLAGRFQLTSHREQREMNVYVLTVAKGGAKMKPADPAEAHGSGCGRLGVCNFQNDPLEHFAKWLQLVMDKPVVDKTGLAGAFDFTLTWTPDESQFTSMGIHVPPAADNPDAPPGLFTAIQEQQIGRASCRERV